MDYKRVLTIQDISCVGQCSLTVALPIISACAVECATLPSAVLSNHTAGFTGFTFRDLSDDMPAISAQWEKDNISFNSIYTGYLGSIKQIDFVADIFEKNLLKGGKIIVDPAMADRGKFYKGFDMEYAIATKKLCRMADYILPNITESCFLTGTPYKEEYDKAYIDRLFNKFAEMGCKNVILTGVSLSPEKTGIAVCENGEFFYYEHDLLEGCCHGTGDVFASAFTGALTRGKTAFEASKIAADFTLECIKNTARLPNHWYGVAFEPVLPKLIKMLEN